MKQVEQKYYWYLWSYINARGDRAFEMQITYKTHPFVEIARRRAGAPPNAGVVLVNWKEITKEEHELYRKS